MSNMGHHPKSCYFSIFISIKHIKSPNLVFFHKALDLVHIALELTLCRLDMVGPWPKSCYLSIFISIKHIKSPNLVFFRLPHTLTIILIPKLRDLDTSAQSKWPNHIRGYTYTHVPYSYMDFDQ